MGGTYALIVAAGRGHRAGSGVPKQYRDLAGTPMLRRTVGALTRAGDINGVCCVIHPDDRPLYDAATQGLSLVEPVSGGATRQASVHAGLEHLAPLEPDLILVHDAARPFVPADLVARVLAGAREAGAAIAAQPVVDTLKRGAEDMVAETVDRAGLWRAQTPQVFRFRELLEAHRAVVGGDLGDDAAVAQRASIAVKLVPGSEDNFKITSEEDFARAEAMLTGAAIPRTGLGFDVHGFTAGDHVWLCGVRVDHERGLSGHSDADVGLHALTDAILGAAADGDIGVHFSDRDSRWKGASSDRFLGFAIERLAAKGGRLVHADLTLICEAPRLGPHRAAMLGRLSVLTGLPPGAIGLKATTTEKMGFLGRGEGIAAQAVATALFPIGVPGLDG